MISDYSVFDVLEFLTAQAVTCQNFPGSTVWYQLSLVV